MKNVHLCSIKYPVSVTAKNYVPYQRGEDSDEFERKGYVYRLYQRVPVADLLKVQRVVQFDCVNHVGRYVYYLEGQGSKAFQRARKSIEEALGRMHSELDQTLTAWQSAEKSIFTPDALRSL